MSVVAHSVGRTLQTSIQPENSQAKIENIVRQTCSKGEVTALIAVRNTFLRTYLRIVRLPIYD